MGKAINREGSIRKRKTGKLAGKWRVQWSYDDPVTNQPVFIDKTFARQEDGRNYLADLKAKVRTGQMVEATKAQKPLTLAAWFEALAGTRATDYAGLWLEDGMSRNSIDQRISRFNKHVQPSEIADKPIPYIAVEDVRRLYQNLRKNGISDTTLYNLKKDLVKIVNDAIDTYEKFPNIRNVFSKVRVETPIARDGVALRPEEAKEAISSQTNDEDRAMLGLYLLSGLRVGEVMALGEDQIDFEAGTIFVDRSARSKPRGELYVGLPKRGTKRDPKYRVVVMCPTLIELLRPIMKGYGKFVFPAKDGDKLRPRHDLYDDWDRIAKNGNLPPTMVMRDCRLSHNNWIEKLMTLVSDSTRLEHMGHGKDANAGDHKGMKVNLTNYTRVLTDAHDVLRDELERVLGMKKPHTVG